MDDKKTPGGRDGRPLPFQRYVEAKKAGLPMSTLPMPDELPRPSRSGPRPPAGEGADPSDDAERPLPFQRFVEAKKAGMPVTGLPLPHDSRRYETRGFRMAAAVVLLVVVLGAMVYLDRKVERSKGQEASITVRPEGEGLEAPGGAPRVPEGGGDGVAGAAGAGAANAAGAAAAGTAEAGAAGANTAGAAEAGTSTVAAIDPHPILPLRAALYIDPGDGRSDRPAEGTVREGDYVTITANVRGRRYLYFLVLGTTDTFRLSRIYPPEQLMMTSAPPLKFTVRGRNDGAPWQVVLLESKLEITPINAIIQDANLLEAKGDVRKARLEKLVAGIAAVQPAETWTWKALEPLRYVR